MSIPDDVISFSFTFNIIMYIILALFTLFMVYFLIFHAIPYEEEKEEQLEEIKNSMSCGELKQMMIDSSAISRHNQYQVEHQYEWRCER